MNRSGKNDGSLMMESLVAISLVVVGLFGIFNLVYISLGADNLVIHKLQATYLAAEGIEVMKNILDASTLAAAGWPYPSPDSFYPSSDTTFDGLKDESEYKATYGNGEPFLMFYAPVGDFQYIDGTTTPFQRKVTVSVSGFQYVVSSTVSWSERGRDQSITLEDTFYEKN